MSVNQRFVIRYRGLADPSHDEESELLGCLEGIDVLDRMAGMVLVEGDEARIASAVSHAPMWTYSLETTLTVSPPHHKVRRG